MSSIACWECALTYNWSRVVSAFQIHVLAEHLLAEVVLYNIGVSEPDVVKTEIKPDDPSNPSPTVVTMRHWLRRYEELLREADLEGKILKSPPSGYCELVTMEIPTIDLLPTGEAPTPAKFRQGICRGSCFVDPVSRRKRCCKPATLEDFEFSYATADGSRRFRRIARFLVTACGFR
ncbi:hypothetical protein PENTCL1PPCAC_9231 [Pristionchus entomophagus]|uniref:Uncharacterized protein n=1 Tax=Pristionchus entomophagus TaxID=358040 RepID=A0AAV5SUM8_9BILA|nr:hypothetical protein PENTCL1PPCAC_9231 [Pristionchus entomophagus]